MNGKIYKITNTITREAYIGQTVNSLEERFRHHKQGTRQPKKYMTKLQKAMDLYGKPAFTIELIEDGIETIEELCEKEKYYIKLYRTQNEYNSTVGGESKLRLKANRVKFLNNVLKIESRDLLTEMFLFNIIQSVLCENSFNITISYSKIIGILSLPKSLRFSEIQSIIDNLLYNLQEKLIYKENKLKLMKNIINDKDMETVEILLDKDNPIFSTQSAGTSKFNVVVYNNFTTSYSKYLYKIICLYMDNNSTSVTFSKDELVKYLKIPSSYRTNQIKTKIIEPSLVEIEREFNGIVCDFIRRGRIINKYKFIWN